MARIAWHALGTREFEYGVDRAVFYPQGRAGVVWDGLTAVNEAPSGSESLSTYLDGVKVRTRLSQEEFSATVGAISYPDVVEQYEGIIGKPLSALPFDLTYRTRKGTDTNADASRQIHLVYNARVSPISRNLSTMSRGVQFSTFNWSLTTMPVRTPGLIPTAHLVLDDAVVDRRIFPMLEDILYGTDDTMPQMPSLEEVADILDTDLLWIRTKPNGLSDLVDIGPWDVQGKLRRGLYKRSKKSRLKETATPGLYILE